jgi:hypothetical protein
MLLGGDLHDSVDELLSFDEMHDMVVSLEPPPPFLHLIEHNIQSHLDRT